MTGEIKVTTGQLKTAAATFKSKGGSIQNISNQMISLVTGISDQVWSGQAAASYKRKFKGFQDDIEKMMKLINEHVDDLNEMAKAYDEAERENSNLINQIPDDVVS